MNSKVKKFLVSCAITVAAVSAVASPLALAESPSANVTTLSKQSISPKAEETKVYYRTLSNGQVQYRIWSVTQGKWLTDWINV